MSGGEEICAKLRASGICPNAICISWNSMVMEPKFSNLIPSLDKILLNFDTISSSAIVCTEYSKEMNGNCPSCLIVFIVVRSVDK